MAADNRLRNTTGASLMYLLKPQYRELLRCSRRRPYLFRLCRNLSLIVCFATCLCAAAYLHRLADEIMDESFEITSGVSEISQRKLTGKTKPSIALLKKVLEQRGVSSDHVIEREEINVLLKLTGEVTEDELKFRERSQSPSSRFQSSISPDTILHAQIVSPSQVNEGTPVNPVKGAESVVFDSEVSFVERVDDNKDSVWLLSVITADSHYHSNPPDSQSSLKTLITDEVWGHLVHRYSPFGFKMGMINCRRLRSLCYERGLIAADLILALPKGGDRIKDSVQYRAFPKQATTRQSASVPTDIVLQQVHNWLAGVLAERIRHINAIDDIVPASFEWTTSSAAQGHLRRRWLSWLTGRPKPIHVIWLSNQTAQFPDNDLRRSTNFPPLVLSALSVPYTGRIRFWAIYSTLQPDSLNPKGQKSIEANHWPAPQPLTNSLMQLLDALGCAKNAIYLIITPEAKCYAFGQHPGEFLSYPNLELHLRLLYPSVDDSVLCFFFLLNLLILLNNAIGAGKLLAYAGRHWLGMSLPYTREHLGLIQSFIRFARQGWTLHRPSRTGQQNTAYDSSFVHGDPTNSPTMSRVHNQFSIQKQIVRWGKVSAVEFLSCNLFFLLTVLPVINALSMSHAACFLNMALWLLRSFVLLSPVVSLRLSIVTGHFTWFRLGGVVVFFYLLITALAAHVYFVLLDAKSFNRLRRRTVSLLSSRRLNRASPDELLVELTRSLLVSDLEHRTEQTTSGMSATSSSSFSEQDPNEPFVSGSELGSDRLSTTPPTEQIRLLRRLGQLHELLHQSTHYLPSTSVAPPEDAAFETQENADRRSTQRAAPAHIYTWQCSRPIQTNEQLVEETTFRPGARNRKSQSLRYLSCDRAGTFNAHPLLISPTEAEYEAEDEDDDSVIEQVPVSSRQACSRRARHRRPRRHVPRQNSSVSSSSDRRSIERISTGRDLSNESNTLMHPSLDWPPWVIPCDECVVCWRMFRPGVRLGALPCGHGFHEACIRRWLDTGALDCPVCRWPAHAPHLRQQRQLIGQLLTAVQSTLNVAGKRVSRVQEVSSSCSPSRIGSHQRHL